MLLSVYTRMHADKTYVLTPFLDVVPEGASGLGRPSSFSSIYQICWKLEIWHEDMPILGSTLNIDDVIQGIEVGDIDHLLSDSQRFEIHTIVNQFGEHQQMLYSMSCWRSNSGVQQN